MKMIYKSFLISLFMVLVMTVTSFANPVKGLKANPAKSLKNELASIGVPSSYIGKIVDYLQKITISEAQYSSAMKYVEEAKAIVKNNKDLNKLSASDKNRLQSLAVKAGSSLGLKVRFGKSSKGVTTVEVIDAKGKAILKLDANNIKKLITNFDISVLIRLLESMFGFSNHPNKGDFIPVGGELTDTAAGYGNVMLMGIAMIVTGVGIACISKKKLV